MTTATRTRVQRIAQVAVIVGFSAIGYGSMLASTFDHVAAGNPTAAPTGRIGTPLSTTKPPREPRLTMPPTDTED